MPSINPCPKCGEYAFHKSHTRGFYEKMRKRLLRQQPYRCHKCGYRGWIASKAVGSKPTAKQLLLYLVVLIVSIIFSLIIKGFLL